VDYVLGLQKNSRLLRCVEIAEMALAERRRESSYLSPHSCGDRLFIDAARMRRDDGVTFGI
jgi:hypothetical protein